MKTEENRGERKTEIKMVKVSKFVMKNVGEGISKTLSEILVCPLTKQPLRFCEKTRSLISDEIGVSFPIVDGIPRLVPKDGKILEEEGLSHTDGHKEMKD